jgi:hypothetical protein
MKKNIEMRTMDAFLYALSYQSRNPLVGCLKTEAITNYLANKVSTDEKRIIENHLKNCCYCKKDRKIIEECFKKEYSNDSDDFRHLSSVKSPVG